MKSVLILEDEVHTRRFLAKAVENEQQMELVGSLGSLAETMSFLGSYDMPDIFLVDLGLPDGNGIELIRHVRKFNQTSVFLVISIFGDEINVVDAIEAGAGGYIQKDEPLDEISLHIQAIIRGESPISPSIARHILNRMQQAPKPITYSLPHACLTTREVEILKILARGYNRGETAKHLEISPHTVTSHIKSIYRKLSVNSRTEAIFEACQLGLLQLNG